MKDETINKIVELHGLARTNDECYIKFNNLVYKVSEVPTKNNPKISRLEFSGLNPKTLTQTTFYYPPEPNQTKNSIEPAFVNQLIEKSELPVYQNDIKNFRHKFENLQKLCNAFENINPIKLKDQDKDIELKMQQDHQGTRRILLTFNGQENVISGFGTEQLLFSKYLNNKTFGSQVEKASLEIKQNRENRFKYISQNVGKGLKLSNKTHISVEEHNISGQIRLGEYIKVNYEGKDYYLGKNDKLYTKPEGSTSLEKLEIDGSNRLINLSNIKQQIQEFNLVKNKDVQIYKSFFSKDTNMYIQDTETNMSVHIKFDKQGKLKSVDGFQKDTPIAKQTLDKIAEQNGRGAGKGEEFVKSLKEKYDFQKQEKQQSKKFKVSQETVRSNSSFSPKAVVKNIKDKIEKTFGRGS